MPPNPSRPHAVSPVGPRSPREAHKIRYTVAEWREIVRRAAACGCEPARYVRETSLGAVPHGQRAQPADTVIDELRRIGLSLSQLSATANAAGSAPETQALDMALAELLAAVRRMA